MELASVGIRVGRDVLEQAAGLSKFDRLLAKGGVFAADGKPFMDFRSLTNAQKSVVGDVLGGEKVKDLMPGAEKVGRTPGIGENGIDDLYKVDKPGVGYVNVECKSGSSKLRKTTDGLQMSDGWLTGANSNYNRILESVNNNEKLADSISDSMRSKRVEKWIAYTDPMAMFPSEFWTAVEGLVQIIWAHQSYWAEYD